MDQAGNLTPNELRNQVFERKMRGYDPLKVAAVLEAVAAQWENLIGERMRLEEKATSLEAQLKKYTDLEQTLRDTLVVACKAAEDEAGTAKKEAGLIVEKARLEADKIITAAQREIETHQRNLSELKMQRRQLTADLQALLQSHTEQLARWAGTEDAVPVVSPPVEKTHPKPPAAPRPPEPPVIPRATNVQQHNLPVGPSPVPSADVPVDAAETPGDFDSALNKIFGGEPDAPVPSNHQRTVNEEQKPAKTTLEEFAAGFEDHPSGEENKTDKNAKPDEPGKK